MGCLLDEARFHQRLARGQANPRAAAADLRAALVYVQRAEERLSTAGVSPGTQLDLDAVSAAIHLRAAASASTRDEAQALTKRSRQGIQRLMSLAEHFGFVPHHGYALLLDGRRRLFGIVYGTDGMEGLDAAEENLFKAQTKLTQIGYDLRGAEVERLLRQVGTIRDAMNSGDASRTDKAAAEVRAELTKASHSAGTLPTISEG